VTWYADLSPYEYMEDGEPMLNVGWLDRSVTFPTGEVSGEAKTALLDLVGDYEGATRGLHYCHFCDAESPILIHHAPADRGRVFLGMSEIRPRRNGVTYAAPSLIIHYIDEHGYLPPAEFLEAAIETAQARKN
jgi:hypothetical protein